MTEMNQTNTLDLAALRAATTGPVTVPDVEADTAVLAGFQLAAPHRPAVLVRAADAQDVRAAVAFASANDLPVGVQATGHGRSVALDGGVLIDTAALDDIRVDASARTARVGAGARWGAVVAATAEHGLAPPNGTAPGVGVGGYLLGGGLALLSRKHGFAADHMRAIYVVTADGTLRSVDAASDPDLFWALRGAGANFGVVTAVEIDLVEAPRLYGGGLFFDAALLPEILVAYRDWTASVSEETSSSVVVLPMPDIPQVPAPIRGRHVASIRIVHAGDAESGARLVAPLRAIGPALLDGIAELPYAECGSIYAEPPVPDAYVGDNVGLRAIDPDRLGDALAIAGPDAPVMCVVDIRHIGGATAREPRVPSAVRRAESPFLLRILSPVSEQDGQVVAELHERFFASVAGLTGPGSLNFRYRPGLPSSEADLRALYGEAAYERLRDLKTVHDPANTFRTNHNIPPRTR